MEASNLMYNVADILSAHQLLKYAKRDTKDERQRMIAGAVLAGLGFAYGPELEQRLLSMPRISDDVRRHAIFAAGGAVLGGLVGYAMGPDLYRARADSLLHATTPLHRKLEEALSDADPSKPGFDPARPGGLITVASAGWLGYSLFMREQDKEARQRQLWGLGAGSVGYLYAPEMLRRLRGIKVSKEAGDLTLDTYSRGAAAFGAFVGGVIGWHASRK